MRYSVVLAAAAALILPTAASALQSQDARVWTEHAIVQNQSLIIEAGDGPLRWRLNGQDADLSNVLISGDTSESRDLSVIAGQIDFYPFGDEFFVSAGAVHELAEGELPNWALAAEDPAWSAFPHTELTDDLRTDRLDRLTRYLGAGVTVRDINQWNLTLEGGAYFRDGGEDRLEVAGFDGGHTVQVRENLDAVDRAAVGDTNARTVKPVAHFVLRRRF